MMGFNKKGKIPILSINERMVFFYFIAKERNLFMIYVNTGNGKGKTTAAVGQVIRSLGRGWKVCIIQLFKGKEFYGEQKILSKLPNLCFYSFAPKHPGCFKDVLKSDVRKQCMKALKKAKDVIKGKKSNLIVLEEFNIALRDKFIEYSEFEPILKSINNDTYVIVTGRGAPKALIRKADLVTEMKEIKHPYKKGIKAKKGVEF